MTVAIDWGSTSFRAFHFDDAGNLLNKYQGEHGIKKAQSLKDQERNAWFENTLVETCGSWIDIDRETPSANRQGFAKAWLSGGSEDAVDVVLSGMVTSRNGWVETPYIECPIQLDDLRKHSVRRTLAGFSLAFLPGVSVIGSHPDVMRGEELQLIGVELSSVDGVSDASARGAASIAQDHTIFVLPGTHSKWVSCRGSVNEGVANGAQLTIESFHTCPSGELYDSLLNHTLIGGLAEQGNWSEMTFLAAVKSGFSSQRLLMDELAAEPADNKTPTTPVTTMLSGQSPNIVLIGEPQLCGLYLQALQALNIPARVAGEDMSEAGFKTLLGY